MQPSQVPPSSASPATPDAPSRTRGPRFGIVLGVLVLLALILGGGFLALRGSSSPIAVEIAKATGDSEAVKAKATRYIKSLSDTLQNFRIDNDRYPTAKEGLEALRVRPAGAPNWRGPYTKAAISKDPWGNPYVYQWPGPLGDDSFSVISYGSDGVPGGSGDAEDIDQGER